MSQMRPYMLLLGGSFNPPHIGHLRIAIEAREVLQPEIILFIPCASPPHKPSNLMLPFDLRLALLREAITDLPAEWNMRVCEVENERPGPSYTVDTLEILAKHHSDMQPVFIMGAEDYAQLHTWRRWQDLPSLADLAILPRKEYGRSFFLVETLKLWPDAQPVPSSFSGAEAIFTMPDGKGRVLYLPQPLLDISSSLIRQRMLTDRSLDFLLPRPVEKMLHHYAEEVRSCWQHGARFSPQDAKGLPGCVAARARSD